MDTWKSYDITHREHVICNPTSEEKLGRLVELLRLPVDGRVVDIACGKGEFLSRLTQAYGVRSLPNFLLFNGGKVVTQIAGAVSKQKLGEAVQKVL